MSIRATLQQQYVDQQYGQQEQYGQQQYQLDQLDNNNHDKIVQGSWNF
jgi:hypothetical protein